MCIRDRSQVGCGPLTPLEPDRQPWSRRTMKAPNMVRQSPRADTVDQDEVARFSRLAAEWWDARGPMAPLHKFNPVRLAYVRDRVAEHFSRDPKRLDSLSELRVLDTVSYTHLDVYKRHVPDSSVPAQKAAKSRARKRSRSTASAIARAESQSDSRLPASSY